MPKVETINIALPSEMVALVRAAVGSGEYATTSEVVSDALQDWTLKHPQGELRRLVAEGVESGPSIEAEPVFERLTSKYFALASEAE